MGRPEGRRERKKHGVTFQEAAAVLEHTLSITFRDPDHSIEEFASSRSGRARSGVSL